MLPRKFSGKESACQRRRFRRHGLDPWVGKIPWRRAWQPIPVFLPGGSHGQRSLVLVYDAWGYKESDTTEQLTHTQASFYIYLRKDKLSGDRTS